MRTAHESPFVRRRAGLAGCVHTEVGHIRVTGPFDDSRATSIEGSTLGRRWPTWPAMGLRPLFRALVPLALALVVAVAVSSAAVTPLQAHARDVRSAIPAAEAYHADNGTYAGMTVAKLRRIDTSLKRVLVREATKNRYCIQSTLAPFVHFTGPGGLTRAGACGVKGTAIPYVSAPRRATRR